ncbi:antitoxin [Saccharopolyspora sp. NPDC000995]
MQTAPIPKGLSPPPGREHHGIRRVQGPLAAPRRGTREKIEQGLDKAADAAKEKSGHEEQIDKGVEKGEELLADSDRDPASSGSRRTSPPGAC